MIRHYITLVAEFPEEDGEQFMDLSVDHHFLLTHFGGVAYDTDQEKWLTPSQLTGTDADNDSTMLSFLSSAIYQSQT